MDKTLRNFSGSLERLKEIAKLYYQQFRPTMFDPEHPEKILMPSSITSKAQSKLNHSFLNFHNSIMSSIDPKDIKLEIFSGKSPHEIQDFSFLEPDSLDTQQFNQKISTFKQVAQALIHFQKEIAHLAFQKQKIRKKLIDIQRELKRKQLIKEQELINAQAQRDAIEKENEDFKKSLDEQKEQTIEEKVDFFMNRKHDIQQNIIKLKDEQRTLIEQEAKLDEEIKEIETKQENLQNKFEDLAKNTFEDTEVQSLFLGDNGQSLLGDHYQDPHVQKEQHFEFYTLMLKDNSLYQQQHQVSEFNSLAQESMERVEQAPSLYSQYHKEKEPKDDSYPHVTTDNLSDQFCQKHNIPFENLQILRERFLDHLKDPKVQANPQFQDLQQVGNEMSLMDLLHQQKEDKKANISQRKMDIYTEISQQERELKLVNQVLAHIDNPPEQSAQARSSLSNLKRK